MPEQGCSSKHRIASTLIPFLLSQPCRVAVSGAKRQRAASSHLLGLHRDPRHFFLHRRRLVRLFAKDVMMTLIMMLLPFNCHLLILAVDFI